jgi:hypothetical protein
MLLDAFVGVLCDKQMVPEAHHLKMSASRPEAGKRRTLIPERMITNRLD